MLYSPYPKDWPTFASKDKIANWLEQYAIVHDLFVWTSSTMVPLPHYDEDTKSWDVVIDRNGTRIGLKPAHLIMAISTFGKGIIPNIPGKETFKGRTLHSSAFPGGAAFAGQRVVVLGAANSAADVCQDLVRSGAAEVTLVQRSATIAISAPFVAAQMASFFPEGVPPEINDAPLTS